MKMIYRLGKGFVHLDSYESHLRLNMKRIGGILVLIVGVTIGAASVGVNIFQSMPQDPMVQGFQTQLNSHQKP